MMNKIKQAIESRQCTRCGIYTTQWFDCGDFTPKCETCAVEIYTASPYYYPFPILKESQIVWNITA